MSQPSGSNESLVGCGMDFLFIHVVEGDTEPRDKGKFLGNARGSFSNGFLIGLPPLWSPNETSFFLSFKERRGEVSLISDTMRPKSRQFHFSFFLSFGSNSLIHAVVNCFFFFPRKENVQVRS